MLLFFFCFFQKSKKLIFQTPTFHSIPKPIIINTQSCISHVDTSLAFLTFISCLMQPVNTSTKPSAKVNVSIFYSNICKLHIHCTCTLSKMEQIQFLALLSNHSQNPRGSRKTALAVQVLQCLSSHPNVVAWWWWHFHSPPHMDSSDVTTSSPHLCLINTAIPAVSPSTPAQPLSGTSDIYITTMLWVYMEYYSIGSTYTFCCTEEPSAGCSLAKLQRTSTWAIQ